MSTIARFLVKIIFAVRTTLKIDNNGFETLRAHMRIGGIRIVITLLVLLNPPVNPFQPQNNTIVRILDSWYDRAINSH